MISKMKTTLESGYGRTLLIADPVYAQMVRGCQPLRMTLLNGMLFLRDERLRIMWSRAPAMGS